MGQNSGPYPQAIGGAWMKVQQQISPSPLCSDMLEYSRQKPRLLRKALPTKCFDLLLVPGVVHNYKIHGIQTHRTQFLSLEKQILGQDHKEAGQVVSCSCKDISH